VLVGAFSTFRPRVDQLVAYSDQFYPEIAALKPGCRFSDCTHSHEPSCAVRLAARQGRLSAMRLRNCQRIRETLPESLADEREQAQERAWR